MTENSEGIAFFILGNSYYKQQRYVEACEAYKKAVKLIPDYVEAYLEWGRALYHLKQYQDTAEKYQKVTELSPDCADAYMGWGYALHSMGSYEEAIHKYQKVAELSPDYAVIYFYWGNILLVLGRYEEASEKYQKVTELNPSYADAYFYWGNALYNGDRKAEALHKYQKATELNPDCANAYLYWGEILYELKIYDSAAEKFEKFTQLISNRADAYFKWGNSLHKLHKYVEATEKYQKARELDPTYRMFIYSQNLQGISFKGQDLTNINFSYADIRGADFSNANLTSVNFNYAQTGLQEHWVLFWLIIPLLVFLLLAQVYFGLLFNSMSIIDTALINTSSFKAIHALISVPVPNFLLIDFWQLFFDKLNGLNFESAIQNYTPVVIDIIHYLTIIPIILVLTTFLSITIFRGGNFALKRDIFPFILLVGIALTVGLSSALFGNIKITVLTTIIEFLFSTLAILMVVLLTLIGIINVAVYGFINPNIPVLRHRVVIVFLSLFASIFDGIWSVILLFFRIVTILLAIVSCLSKDDLSNYFRQHIKQQIKSNIIGIVWIYSLYNLIYLYFLAITTLGFVFITITGIQTFLAGYIIFRTLEGDENFSLLKRFTIDVVAARGTSFRNANLRNASFNQVNLKNTDFGGAIIINTYLRNDKNYLLARINK